VIADDDDDEPEEPRLVRCARVLRDVSRRLARFARTHGCRTEEDELAGAAREVETELRALLGLQYSADAASYRRAHPAIVAATPKTSKKKPSRRSATTQKKAPARAEEEKEILPRDEDEDEEEDDEDKYVEKWKELKKEGWRQVRDDEVGLIFEYQGRKKPWAFCRPGVKKSNAILGHNVFRSKKEVYVALASTPISRDDILAECEAFAADEEFAAFADKIRDGHFDDDDDAVRDEYARLQNEQKKRLAETDLNTGVRTRRARTCRASR